MDRFQNRRILMGAPPPPLGGALWRFTDFHRIPCATMDRFQIQRILMGGLPPPSGGALWRFMDSYGFPCALMVGSYIR